MHENNTMVPKKSSVPDLLRSGQIAAVFVWDWVRQRGIPERKCSLSGAL